MTDSIAHSNSSNNRNTDPWRGFHAGAWKTCVDVRNFLQTNVQPYLGGASFLVPVEDDVRDVSMSFALSVALRAAGMPYASVRPLRVENRLIETRSDVSELHSPQINAARDAALLHGMPEPMSRSATAADCRRVALYGVDFLRAERRQQLATLNQGPFTQTLMQRRRDLSEQMLALEELREVALAQGVDINRPAANAHEAVQWMALAAMAAAGAHEASAFPVGRVSAFLDVYIQRDMDEGVLNERQAQALIDELLLKLANMNRLCAQESDGAAVVECVGGVSEDGSALVTRTSFRLLHSLRHGSAEHMPQIAVLWSPELPRAFRHFCADVANETGRLRFENDVGLRSLLGDDYVIGSHVPALSLGQQVLLDAGRINLPKALLYAINGGVDEQSGVLVIQGLEPFWGDVLEYEDVVARLDRVLDWLAVNCVASFNAAHFLHERQGESGLAMALHDCHAAHVMACSLEGLAVFADSLSAIRYAAVQVVRDEDGLAVGFQSDEPYPACGRIGGVADAVALATCDAFVQKLRAQPCVYRDAQPVIVLAGSAANALAGKQTGATPCGRLAGAAFPAWSTDEARAWSTGDSVRNQKSRQEMFERCEHSTSALAEAD